MKIQKGIPLQPADAESKLTAQKQQLRDASEMYETYFLNHMVKSMRKTVDRENGMMKPNFAENIFSEQLDNQYVEGWSKKGGIGLADMIFDQINQRIEGMQKRPIQKGAIPIAPKQEPIGVPSSDSIRMKAIPQDKNPQASLEYRFEVVNPSGSTAGPTHEAKAPIDGKVVESKSLSDGWQSVRLDHGQGLTSELTFPGSAPQMSAGQDVQAGQRLGLLDSTRPVLAWKLDWT